MRPAGSSSVAAMVLVTTALGFVGCTFGLGEYAVRGSEELVLPSEATDASTLTAEDSAPAIRPSTGDDGDGGDDSGDANEGGPTTGPCAEGTSRACSEPDKPDAAAICQGTQACILGQWAPCAIKRTCPATWAAESTPAHCRKTNAIGNSPDPTWTETPTQGFEQIWWRRDRVMPFDTYGQNDQFCFIPKQAGNCSVTSKTSLEVLCTNNNLKLTGNQFEDGSIHDRRFCVDHAGASCTVNDRSHRVWTAGAIACTRWFTSVAFVVEAEPRCAPW